MRITDTFSYIDQTSLRPGISSKTGQKLSAAEPKVESDFASSAVSSAAASHSAKVAQLQSQVQAGKYKIDDAAVSRKIIASRY